MTAHQKCQHCKDSGWVWRHELPDTSDWDGQADDTKYTCPYCNHSDREFEDIKTSKSKDCPECFGNGLVCENYNAGDYAQWVSCPVCKPQGIGLVDNLNKSGWKLDLALDLIRELAPRLEMVGYSVGLCGSVLKSGTSYNDLDILVFPLSTANLNKNALDKELRAFGFKVKYDIKSVRTAWRKQGSKDNKKVKIYDYKGKRVDIFFVK